MDTTTLATDSDEVPYFHDTIEQVTHFHSSGAPCVRLVDITTRGQDHLGLHGLVWDNLPEDEREAWSEWIEDEHDLNVRIAESDPAVRATYRHVLQRPALEWADIHEWENVHKASNELLNNIERAYDQLKRNHDRCEIATKQLIALVEKRAKLRGV